MTEREIPDSLGFLFGGMTDDSQAVSAPPAASEPEKQIGAASTASGATVYRSRREARIARELSADGAPSVPVAPAVSTYEGVATLFPLIPEAGAAPVAAPAPAEVATQAVPTSVMAVELATPVAPYVVPQSAPVPIVSASASAVPAVPVPLASVSASETPSWHLAEAFGLGPSAAEADPIVASRRAMRDVAAPSAPRQKKLPHARRGAREQAERRAWARGEGKSSGRSIDRGTGNAPASRAAGDRKPVRQRIFGVGVMVLVGGLFAVLALPAYADNDASALTAAASVQTQKFAIAKTAASTVTTSSRDGFTATSAADLKKLYSDAIRQRNMAAYLQSGAKAQGDDYPWFAELSRNQGGGLSPLNYYYRECVDFVAWRINRDQGSVRAPFKWVWSNLTPSGGNASQWKSAWLNHGWATGTTPVVGAVAWFPYNHVAYVSGLLNNGQVLLEEYNWEGQHLYGTRVINAGDAYYLYAPPG